MVFPLETLTCTFMNFLKTYLGATSIILFKKVQIPYTNSLPFSLIPSLSFIVYILRAVDSGAIANN